ncbi:unnamed protein product [Tenebrio molitor]|nr:unnamed protein product [Tenebrio molitor]
MCTRLNLCALVIFLSINITIESDKFKYCILLNSHFELPANIH